MYDEQDSSNVSSMCVYPLTGLRHTRDAPSPTSHYQCILTVFPSNMVFRVIISIVVEKPLRSAGS